MVVSLFTVVVYILTFLIGFGGNLWVICSVLRSRKPRNSLSHMNTSDRLRSYISFLAGLDLTVVFPLLIRVAYVILPTATVDATTCRFVFGLEHFAKLSSLTCLASISFERYITIRKPFNNKMRKHVIHMTPMVAMFVLSVLLTAMGLRIPHVDKTDDEMNCMQTFGDDALSRSTESVLSGAFLTLLLVISASYFQIIRHVRRKFWQRKARVCANLRNNTLVTEPRYMREMTSAIMRVALFHVVCWLPYSFLQFFPKSYGDVVNSMTTSIRQLPTDTSDTLFQWIAFAANWLTCANAAGDWIFYAVMNRELRSLIRATTERRKRSTMSQQSSPSNLHQSLRRQVTQSIRFFHSINSYRSAGCSIDESVTLPGSGTGNGGMQNGSSGCNEHSTLAGRSLSSPKSSVFSSEVTATIPIVTSRYPSQATPRTSLLTADSVERFV
ncbi:hypothetical protein QR680_001374 [Steinernema hermaphroditum]|uniref:G-protein coupled receptors family 1 profile domain-containing protein n=1 Tax=Steinernema hermaphroditum TaxID=289476 RepID=A0AA39GXZ3_9BILA|nr:hypothetical protein QR680_001374 [Steinernema hermaphroditum]